MGSVASRPHPCRGSHPIGGWWTATAGSPIPRGVHVRIYDVDGLAGRVRRLVSARKNGHGGSWDRCLQVGRSLPGVRTTVKPPASPVGGRDCTWDVLRERRGLRPGGPSPVLKRPAPVPSGGTARPHEELKTDHAADRVSRQAKDKGAVRRARRRPVGASQTPNQRGLPGRICTL